MLFSFFLHLCLILILYVMKAKWKIDFVPLETKLQACTVITIIMYSSLAKFSLIFNITSGPFVYDWVRVIHDVKYPRYPQSPLPWIGEAVLYLVYRVFKLPHSSNQLVSQTVLQASLLSRKILCSYWDIRVQVNLSHGLSRCSMLCKWSFVNMV